MPGPEPRTTPCDANLRDARRQKAEQFLEAADLIDVLVDDESDLVDAYVTLCVHAGIAAADAICCARLGRHARGQDHHEAVALLRRVDPDAARDLETVLRLKTKAGYSGLTTSVTDRRRAGRAAERLVLTAREQR
jgi:hypothetical protein